MRKNTSGAEGPRNLQSELGQDPQQTLGREAGEARPSESSTWNRRAESGPQLEVAGKCAIGFWTL